MNEIINKFMPEMHLKQPGFKYSPCGLFTKNRERIEKLVQTGNTDYIYKNDFHKACFQHDMVMVNLKIWLKEHNQIDF